MDRTGFNDSHCNLPGLVRMVPSRVTYAHPPGYLLREEPTPVCDSLGLQLHGGDHSRSPEKRQLDDGIVDTFVLRRTWTLFEEKFNPPFPGENRYQSKILAHCRRLIRALDLSRRSSGVLRMGGVDDEQQGPRFSYQIPNNARPH